MILVVNALVYSLTLYVYHRKKKSFNVGELLLIIYVTAAWFSVAFYAHEMFESSIHYGDLTWSAYLYLYVALILFFYPVLRFDNNKIIRYEHPDSTRYYVLSYILFGASVLYIILYLPYAVKGLSGDIAANRDLVMETGVQVVKDPILSLFVRVYGALNSIAILLSFYGLVFLKKHRRFATLFFIVSVSAPLVSSFAYSARTDIVFLSMSMGFLYILFYKFIDSRLRWKINIGIAAVVCALFFIGYIITISRFGDIDNFPLEYFLVKYPGESFVNFSTVLFGKTSGFTDGYTNFPLFRRMFGLEYFKTLSDKRAFIESVTNVPSFIFYQFVGSFYIDFGAVGALLLAAFTGMVSSKIVKSQSVIGFHQLIVLTLLLDVYAKGVFYFPLGHEEGNLRIIFTIIIYLYFRFSRHRDSQIIKQRSSTA